MPHAIVDGLALIDPTGRLILTTTLLCLFLAVIANLFVRARYARLQRDLESGAQPFAHDLLNHIVDEALEAARRSDAPNTQAIIEDRFQSELKSSLLAERFVKAATGLVIILGLLGTFYGLTLSVGRIVGLVAGDTPVGADVAGAVTTGLTHALSGMAVAFSNSLLGILSAVILTVLGVFVNVTDRRVGLMLRIESYLDRLIASRGRPGVATRAGQPSGDVAGFREAVARLEDVVTRFESSLKSFAESSGDFQQFNVHLKDNIQRMSLSFGDFSETLKGQIGTLRARDGR
ncbi:MAG TPA: hypothetical protein VIA18_03620 [Polyangia bacterium]|nr:hypothetical protein [Polyangia bacterium]